MMTKARLFLLAAMVPAAGALAGCLIVPTEVGPDQTGSKPCVSRFLGGEALTVRLGAVYDARSDYWHEEGLLGPSLPGIGIPSCGPTDGLQTGSVLTFALTGRAAPSGGECLPWEATLQPDAVTGAERAGGNLVPALDGVTIAVAGADGTLAGRSLFAFRGLFTPSRDPDGTLTTGALPPLAVTRELSFSTPDRYDRCFDAWVATWESPP